MTYRLSRLMSAATASYGVFALAVPRHLGNALTTNPLEQADYDVLARTYGARDLAVSAVGLLARSEAAVTAAMVVRIASDLSDCVLLSLQAKDSTARAKVLGVTLGWAALNIAALVADRRRAG
jgi:hypothetical protein